MESRTLHFPVPTPRSATEVRLLVWNVWYGRSPTHGNDIVAALKKFDCDVLLLSELNCKWGFPHRILELGYGGIFAEIDYAGVWERVHGGVALFTRFPVCDWRFSEMRLRRECGARRPYIEARLRVSEDDELTVAVTHGGYPWERDYADVCDALLREVKTHDTRFVFGGDLNALPHFRFIRELRASLVHLGPPLHLTSYPKRRIIRWIKPHSRLDYAFGTPDIKVEEVRFGENRPSDHRPILVRLRAHT